MVHSARLSRNIYSEEYHDYQSRTIPGILASKYWKAMKILNLRKAMAPMQKINFLCVTAIAAVAVSIITGCSSTNPASPATPGESARDASSTSHQLWGYYQFTIDPDAAIVDITPLRHADLHMNVLPFLEPPALLNLTLETLQFNGNIIEADIGLRHPFLGLNQFTGFDVRGIFITSGSVTGFSNPDLRLAGESDTRLLNPDGYTRWWNPSEFPVNTGTIAGYNDGLLGTPDSVGNFNCTLNGYKYFCDDLDDTSDPLDEITLANRGLFSAGQKNVRHYTIRMQGGLVFNYAIDASWVFPTGSPPYEVPDDFGPAANSPEPFRISASAIENTLYYKDDNDFGGDLALLIDVYDWTDPAANTVMMESIGVFQSPFVTIPIGGGEGYSTYAVEISDATPISSDPINVLITVEDPVVGYEGLLPGENIASYQIISVDVGSEPPEPPSVGNWLISQGDIGHTGYLERYGPADLHSAPTWTSDYVPTVGNALSIFLNDDTAFMSFAGVIYDTWFPTIAVNLSDGSTKWTKAFHEDIDYYTQPKGISPDGFILLVCEVHSPSSGGPTGFLAGLDVEDGSVVWQHPVGDYILVDSYATHDLDGNFIVATNHGYQSIDPVTGAINWTNSSSPGYCTPAVGPNGRIYGMDGQYLQAYDPANGNALWYEYPAPGNTNFGVTVLDNGKILAAGANGVFLYTDTGSGASADWEQPYSYCPYGSAAVGPDGSIYMMDNAVPNGGYLLRLDPLSGNTLNSSGTWGHAGTRPVVGEDGIVYVNSRESIRAFDEQCNLLWSYTPGSDNHFCAPAIAEDGTLYSSKRELGLCAWHD